MTHVHTTLAGTEHAFHEAATVNSRLFHATRVQRTVRPSSQRYPSVDGFLPTAAATRKYVKRTLGGISRTSFRGVTPAGSKHRSRVGDAAVHRRKSIPSCPSAYLGVAGSSWGGKVMVFRRETAKNVPLNRMVLCETLFTIGINTMYLVLFSKDSGVATD